MKNPYLAPIAMLLPLSAEDILTVSSLEASGGDSIRWTDGIQKL